MLEAPTIAPITDEILVQRARSNDSAAREELFQRYRNDAYRVAYRLLGNEQDALDVVQESLLKAFSRLADFDGRCGFRYWLLRIVSNSALDSGRSRKRRRTVGLDERTADATINDDPGRRLRQQDLRRALDEALERLSPKIRTTFVLFAELGMSYKEIAETQEVPIGTVMSRINAAREKLQAALDFDQLKGLD